MAGGCTLVSVLVAYVAFSHRALSLDESFTLLFATMPWASFTSHIQHTHTPDVALTAYYLLMRAWHAFTGPSAVAFRVPSMIFGSCAAIVLYYIARRLFDRWVAAIATSVFVCNAMWLVFATNARAYTLVLFLALVSTLLFLEVVSTRSSVVAALAYSAAVGLTFFAHVVVATLAVLGHAASLPFFAPLKKESRFNLALSAALIVTITAAQIEVALHFGAEQSTWVPVPSPEAVLALLQSLSGGKFAFPLTLLLVGIALARAAKIRSRETAVVAVWLVAPVCVAFLVSVFASPHSVWIDRYLLWAVFPLALLAAVGIAAIPSRGIRVVTIVVLIALEAAGSAAAIRAPFERWDILAQFLHERVQSNDIVYFYYPYYEIPFEAATEVGNMGPLRGAIVVPPNRFQQPSPYVESKPLVSTNAVRIAAPGAPFSCSHPRLWLIGWTPTAWSDWRVVASTIAQHYESVREQFRGVALVELYTQSTDCPRDNR